MSYTTLYRIDSDGNLSAVAEIRNSHGGQPLVWDLLEDEFDPPSPDWLRRYSFLARDGKISGRWMFDSGDPQTSGITFFSGHGVEVGVWECTPGGWAIVDRPTTETMMLLGGTAVITPADGEPVELGEGDVFVLPKGWSGRWDVTETVRKLYVLVG